MYLSSLYEALRYLQPAAVTFSQEVRGDEPGAVEETVLRTTTTTVVEVKKTPIV